MSDTAAAEQDLDLTNVAWVEKGAAWIGAMERYFRYELHGVCNVPTEGPGVLVTPHSLVSVDGLLLCNRVLRDQGRLPRALGDHVLFEASGMRRLLSSVGVVDGTPVNAQRLLERRELLFIMPGGANEAWQPSRNKYRVFWDGHYGFVRAALRGRAPVIPSVCIGAEDALYLPFHSLNWGKRLLRRRMPVFLGVGALGLIPVPFPVKFTAYVGEPIHFNLPPEAADDLEAVKGCHARVVEAITAMTEAGLRNRRSVWR